MRRAIAAVELVPDGANIVVQVELAGILDDEDVAAFYGSLPEDEGQPRTFQDLLAEAQDAIGVDLRQFSRLLLFGDFSSDDFFAVIVEGSFDQHALLSALADAVETEFSATDYKGHELHSFVGPDEDDFAVVFLDDDTLVLGTPDVVRQVVDVLEGDRKRLDGPVLERLQLPGRAFLA